MTGKSYLDSGSVTHFTFLVLIHVSNIWICVIGCACLASQLAFGIGDRNDRGDGLIEFAEEHKLIIVNTLFQKPNTRYWTWLSPDGETRNQIQIFALCNQRGRVTYCEVITKADIGSDHRSVRITLKMNTINKQKPFNINTYKLKGMKETFEITGSLENRFKKLEMEVTASNFIEIM